MTTTAARGPNSGRPIPPFDIARLLKHCVRDEATECLVFTGCRNVRGYGRFMIPGNSPFPAHRCAYVHAKGQIPVGMSLDHLCHNPACCNPDHLEPVTHAENHARRVRSLMVRRGSDGAAYICKYGHTEAYRDNRGKRSCAVCRRAALVRNHARGDSMQEVG